MIEPTFRIYVVNDDLMLVEQLAPMSSVEVAPTYLHEPGAEPVQVYLADAAPEPVFERNAGGGDGTPESPFRGSWTTRPADGSIPERVEWWLWWTGDEWRTSIKVSDEWWAQRARPSEIKSALYPGIPEADADAVAHALMRRIAAAHVPIVAGGAPRNAARAAADVDLVRFAVTVRRLADDVEPDPNAAGLARGRFGERKVFIAAIRRALRATEYRGLSRADVNRLLVDANREGLLQLARADMPQVMDRIEVRESEIRDLGSTFHFVLSPRPERNVASSARRRR